MKKTLILLALALSASGAAHAQTAGDKAPRARRTAYQRERAVYASPRVVQAGPRTTYLKEGLSTQDVIQLLGRPSEVSERTEGGQVIVTYVFQRGERRILVAEFAQGRLVASRVETRDDGPRAEFVNF